MNSLLSQVYYSHIQSNIIRFFDVNTPLYGIPYGFKFLHVINLDKQLINFFTPKLKATISRRSTYFLKQPDISYACSLILPHVHQLVRSYLGSTASLDFVKLSILYPEDHTNTSGIPHHDSVGHRLKLFVPLRIPGTAITPTKYVTWSNKTKWKTYVNPLRADNTRIDRFWKIANEVELVAPCDNVYIFDTNGIHWGVYNTIAKPRVNLVMEFSNIKSYFIRGDIGYRITCNTVTKKCLAENQLIPPHLIFSS